MLPVSNDTLLRVVRRRTCPRTEPLIVVGIDDWAFRRNHRYGTIVCDLERRRIVALLPDREIATVRAWLSDHPEIRIVSRDRGGGYGEAAAKALPGAIQVADRWHLMENASAAFLDAVRRSMRVIRTAIGATTINPTCSPVRNGCNTRGICDAKRPMPRSWRSSEMQCRSRRSSVGPGTAVNSFARSVAARARISSGPGRARSTPTCPSWTRNGPRAAATVQSSGVACKYKASKAPCVWSASGRHDDDGPRRRPTDNCKKCRPRGTISRLMTTARDNLSKADTVTIAAIEERVPTLVEARKLVERFQAMVRQKLIADLDPWIANASVSLIASFASGIIKDKEAVRAAITEPWSNGQTEGQITKLKLVKRQMYGRAKIDLLQARLIGAA